MTQIETYDGTMFDFENPDPATVSLDAISLSLSKIPRFGGHLQNNWTVLQHSLCCALEARARKLHHLVVKSCLMHDFAEAYVGDIPAPLKRILPDFKEVEKRVEKAIWEKFRFFPQGYKEIDKQMTKYEAYFFLPSKGSAAGFHTCTIDTLQCPIVRNYLMRTAIGDDCLETCKIRFLHAAMGMGLTTA